MFKTDTDPESNYYYTYLAKIQTRPQTNTKGPLQDKNDPKTTLLNKQPTFMFKYLQISPRTPTRPLYQTVF